jgi:hypothetical protein
LTSVPAHEDDGGRRSRLLGIKLRALVAEHLGEPLAVEPEGFPDGAALVVGDAAWVLIDGNAERSLGRALAWSVRQGATGLNLIADTGTGLLARRATRFSFPISVWYPIERTLVAAVAEPLTDPPAAAPHHLAFTSLIEAAGATPIVEHSVVSGEVRGLEVCRVVDSPTTGYFDEDTGLGDTGAMVDETETGEVMVEVGVGAPDREAFRILHGDVPTADALAEVVEVVEARRFVGAPPHPLNRLAPERLLRWRLQEDPASVGLMSIEPVDPPIPRRGLKDVAPCVAAAVTSDGDPVTLVCSVGVDLDLVPFIADVQGLRHQPVIVALPSRDLVPVTIELAGLLLAPPRFVTVD